MDSVSSNKPSPADTDLFVVSDDFKRARLLARPTLDGLYRIGTMRYMDAPKKVMRSIDKMNRIIKSAKNNMPTRPPKK